VLALLHQLFAGVCGQNLAHTWSPGGLPLPCCQRCTGLYVGALVAAVLHLWLKPRLTGRFLWIHGLFLLQMIPFGFHWLPQGPLLRTVTGALFGFGLATFFWLLPTARRLVGKKATAEKYFTAMVVGVALLLALSVSNSVASASALALFAAGGLLTLAALVLANLWLLAASFLKLTRRLELPTTPPKP